MADKGLTYAEAGVDIDAGNRMVELIKPLVRATARPGADAEIGGFGGLFDLKRAGFSDPVLVAATDGVGTKVKIAIETGRHDTIGIDLVAMSVNDLVVQGAEPLFFLDYFACGKLAPETGAQIVKGVADGCREAGCALIGGETAEMPGLYRAATTTSRASRSAPPSATRCCRATTSRAGDVVLGLASSGVHSNGYSLARRVVEKSRARLGRAGAVRQDAHARRSAADADAHLREIVPRRDARDQGGEGARPHHRRRLPRQHSARAAGRRSASRSISRASRCCRCSSGWRRPAASPSRKCCAPSIAGSAWSRSSTPSGADAVTAVLTRDGETVVRLGKVTPAAAGAPRVAYSGQPRPRR